MTFALAAPLLVIHFVRSAYQELERPAWNHSDHPAPLPNNWRACVSRQDFMYRLNPRSHPPNFLQQFLARFWARLRWMGSSGFNARFSLLQNHRKPCECSLSARFLESGFLAIRSHSRPSLRGEPTNTAWTSEVPSVGAAASTRNRRPLALPTRCAPRPKAWEMVPVHEPQLG